ncbi:DUF1611 domain-containing protein [Bacillus badius]|uniref:D-glutamate N-acetyltransferase-like N-terminal domain-containing protein n=1 Tax=Bacillus badius TaxID=1455 RepID=A0ABR5APN9_BACBA|nr:DUF1611 domain-containing protein [Bacillus badius]KIL74835.1 hypothetical protein SD78_1904 [Bacillus badius]KIL75804.1 hypothetical protein SD77_2753 [Bacillus badius]KZR60004.1 hypothetical protein A3781_07315 [Bacillus badius]MED4718477.1 DUF1611 domain-containing protein [Bacillus badius]
MFYSEQKPDNFILGIAPADAFLQLTEREVIIQAMKFGMNIINTLQEFLTDDKARSIKNK